MLKTILIAVAAAIVLLLAYAATRSDDLRVERKAIIAAAPGKVYALIDDLHQFNRWNPWLAKDPQLKSTYTGPSAGPGASYAWEGNKDVGKGNMTITGHTADRQVLMKLQFIEPFPGENTITFTLTPQAGGTEVSWVMTGKLAFVPKLMGVFFSMDKMIGRDFEQGLANMSKVAAGG